MEKKKPRKLKIILITGGILLACAAVLVTAIVIAGQAEENKILRTAYAEDDAQATEAPQATQSSEETVEESTEPQDEYAPQPTQTSSEASEEPVREIVLPLDLEAEPGSENISEEEALDLIVEYMRGLFGVDVDRATLSVSFYRYGNQVKHDIWGASNENFGCSIDAISGEIIGVDDKRPYSGSDNIASDDFMEIDNNIRKNPTPYTEKASSIVNATLAKGREIEHMFTDGIQVVYDDKNHEQTVLVDVHVLMDKGRSYTLSFIGSEMYLYRFMSHPSQKGCIYGFVWEEEAANYPPMEETMTFPEATPPPMPVSTSSPEATPSPMPVPTSSVSN